MRQSRFTLNMFILIVIIFSVLAFLFTIGLSGMAARSVMNDYYKIEGTDLGIMYSNVKPNGIYKGLKNTAVLKLEGDFGHDWGIAMEGDDLFLNEYSYTTLGMMFCSVARVSTDDFSKETLFGNTILRGRCASGELVCLEGFIMPSNYPETNSLCRFYGMTSEQLKSEKERIRILFVDPEDASVVYSTEADELSDEFDQLYLERTLEEIRK